MAVFPVFLKLESRRVLPVGGGTVASARLGQLLEAGARVTVFPDSGARYLAEGFWGVESS